MGAVRAGARRAGGRSSRAADARIFTPTVRSCRLWADCGSGERLATVSGDHGRHAPRVKLGNFMLFVPWCPCASVRVLTVGAVVHIAVVVASCIGVRVFVVVEVRLVDFASPPRRRLTKQRRNRRENSCALGRVRRPVSRPSRHKMPGAPHLQGRAARGAQMGRRSRSDTVCVEISPAAT